MPSLLKNHGVFFRKSSGTFFHSSAPFLKMTGIKKSNRFSLLLFFYGYNAKSGLRLLGLDA